MFIVTLFIHFAAEFSARLSSRDKGYGSHTGIRHSHLAKTQKRKWTDCQIPCVHSDLGSRVGEGTPNGKKDCTAVHLELRSDRFEKKRKV